MTALSESECAELRRKLAAGYPIGISAEYRAMDTIDHLRAEVAQRDERIAELERLDAENARLTAQVTELLAANMREVLRRRLSEQVEHHLMTWLRAKPTADGGMTYRPWVENCLALEAENARIRSVVGRECRCGHFEFQHGGLSDPRSNGFICKRWGCGCLEFRDIIAALLPTEPVTKSARCGFSYCQNAAVREGYCDAHNPTEPVTEPEPITPCEYCNHQSGDICGRPMPCSEHKTFTERAIEAIAPYYEPPIEHRYLSTYCYHADCNNCRQECKTCGAACVCQCHLLDRAAGVERIKCSAFRKDEVVYEGKPFDGAEYGEGSHHSIAIAEENRGLLLKMYSEQGFVTTTGRFVDRKEGARIALASRRIKRLHFQPDTLFSEDFNHPEDGEPSVVEVGVLDADNDTGQPTLEPSPEWKVGDEAMWTGELGAFPVTLRRYHHNQWAVVYDASFGSDEEFNVHESELSRPPVGKES